MTVVKSLMQREVAVVRPAETVAEAARRMSEGNLGALLVVADGRLHGIFSERDLLRRVVAEGKDPGRTPVAAVATQAPTVVSEDTPIKECTRIIREGGFRHLPMVDGDGRPVGIISSRDLLQFVVTGLESYIESRRALRREEMTDPYETLSEFSS